MGKGRRVLYFVYKRVILSYLYHQEIFRIRGEEEGVDSVCPSMLVLRCQSITTMGNAHPRPEAQMLCPQICPKNVVVFINPQ